MSNKMIAAAAAVAVFTSVSAFAAKTTQQRCGSAIGKALSALERSISKEAARACGTAKLDRIPPVTVEQTVNNGKPAAAGRLGAATNKFNRARAKAYESFTDLTASPVNELENCPDVNAVNAQSVLDETVSRAEDLCQSGTPIPLPTE